MFAECDKSGTNPNDLNNTTIVFKPCDFEMYNHTATLEENNKLINVAYNVKNDGKKNDIKL